MKLGISKSLDRERVEKVTVNAYTINAFIWKQHDPNNLATARLEVVYSLAVIEPEGTVSLSRLPEQCGLKIELYDAGENRPLTRWLEESGHDKGDLLDFNYHDIERLVEADIKTRFGEV